MTRLYSCRSSQLVFPHLYLSPSPSLPLLFPPAFTGQALFRVRASSMESISTTFSLGTLSHTTRSNSVDDLSLPIHRMRSKQDGRKTYLLLDNVSESVPGEATRGGEEQEREKEQREEKLSQSLPGASKACVQRPARKSLSEPEGLSTTLGTQQVQWAWTA